MKPILEASNIGKKYRIGHLQGSYLSLRERIAGLAKFTRTSFEDFWALNDVSFNIQPGQSVGIIGKNGAGKSTLLKILSRITPPTTGKIITRGRIASLLEVGTGFHPELTGRENIFFNGSLLGMKRKEIASRFDAIVDFSGTEKFLDTPLKHYSSGMQLRLAFSVAAFLEPEILVIDEVLAVGDAEFQTKCLRKMEDVRGNGRTILFVSHNMGAVSQLCSTAMYLHHGKLIAEGKTSEIIGKYINQTNQSGDTEFNHAIIIGASASADPSGIHLSVFYQNYQDKALHIGFVITDQFGTKVCGSNPKFANYVLPERIESRGKVHIHIRSPRLNDGMYKVSLWAGNGYSDFFQAEDCLTFHANGMMNQTIQMSPAVIGSVLPEATWEFTT